MPKLYYYQVNNLRFTINPFCNASINGNFKWSSKFVIRKSIKLIGCSFLRLVDIMDQSNVFTVLALVLVLYKEIFPFIVARSRDSSQNEEPKSSIWSAWWWKPLKWRCCPNGERSTMMCSLKIKGNKQILIRFNSTSNWKILNS